MSVSPKEVKNTDAKNPPANHAEGKITVAKRIVGGVMYLAHLWPKKTADRISLCAVLLTITLCWLSYKGYKQQTDSLKFQDSVFRVNQNNFEVSNEPFLQVEVLKIDSFKVGKPINIHFSIKNLGIYPAKVITIKMGGQIGKDEPDLFIENAPNYLNADNYIIKDSPMPLNTADNFQPITEDLFKSLKNSKNTFYAEMYILYKNLINNKNREYKLIIGIEPTHDNRFSYRLNENTDVK